MKNKLDLEEQEIIETFVVGGLKSVKDFGKKLEETKSIARNTFNKNKRVNLRMTERDFDLPTSKV